MLDGEMIAAWLTAARELGVEVVAPHTLVLPSGATVEVEAFLPDFGGPNGAAVVALQDDQRCKLAATTGPFISFLAQSYRAFERSRFQETLDDWLILPRLGGHHSEGVDGVHGGAEEAAHTPQVHR
jgi:hypothetical protein